MTCHRYRRCKHCEIVYIHCVTGSAIDDPLDDGDYCPNCKKAVVNALKDIPPAVEKIWKSVSGIEAKRVLKGLEDKERRCKNGQFGVLGSAPGLIDLETGASQSNRIITVNGVTYSVSRWSDERKPVCIRKAVERNRTTGAERPWLNFD